MKLKKPNKKITLVFVSLVLLLTGLLFVVEIKKNNQENHCKEVVEQIEGDNYTKIRSLRCELESVNIGNSEDLSAKHYKYDGSSGDAQGCLDTGIIGGREDSYCTSGNGVILSDGSIVKNLTGKSIIFPPGIGPCDYNYFKKSKTSSAEPTTDLYFYEGKLYDRTIFTDTKVEVDGGLCVLNGTALRSNSEVLTNVTIDYERFTDDCLAKNQRPYFNPYSCAIFVTAASTSIDYCLDNAAVIAETMRGEFEQGNDRAIALRTDCLETYITRLAAINKCDNLSNDSQQKLCLEKIASPAPNVRRVSGSL